MTENKYFIIEAEVDTINIITWNQEIEQERKSAVFDLLNNGKFKLINKNKTGPYKINIKLLEWKLILRVIDFFDDSITDFKISISNFAGTAILTLIDDSITDLKISISSVRRIIRDYQIVCDNYVEAIKTSPLKKIEAIDIGRRTIHDEGAGMLIEAFKEKVELDMDTARRLFTLVSIISIKI